MPKVNHLIVSLGGTGARIMRAFRKRLFEEFRNIDPDPVKSLAVMSAVREEVFIQYLMVDSSSALFDSHRSWRVLGTSVKPLAANWLHLRQNINVPEWIRNSRNFPGIAQWIGDPRIWSEVPPGVLTGNAGGQRRRLGRVLFAANAERFKSALTTLLNDLTRRSNQPATTFHILCGLAGGTGSGAIIDAVAQIHKLSRHPDDRIVLYAVVPERTPKSTKNQAYYHANAYAALKELNAMLVRNYRPWDVLDGAGGIDVTSGDKLKGIYLISNENAAQHQVHMDDDDDDAGGLSEIVGDFMFEKLVVDHLSNGGQSPIETAENVNDLPERIPETDRALRSRRFLSFGIRRVAVPEEEIAEYFALSFAKQAINHLRYNHWTETAGFIDTPVRRNYLEYVNAPERLQSWQLTDAHLNYVAGVLVQDLNRGWRSNIAAEWDDWMTQTVNAVREVEEKHSWLDEVYAQFQAHFDEGYRGVGVRKFYETRAASARAIVQTMRVNVEQDLIQSWQSGAIALADAQEIATALRNVLAGRVDQIVAQIAALREDSDEAGHAAQIIRSRWANSFLQRTVFKNTNFERMKVACRTKFIADTRLAADHFVEGIGPQLIQELLTLETSIQSAVQHLNRALDEVQRGTDVRLQSRDPGNSGDYILRLVDADAVRRIINQRFVLNREIQARQTHAMRTALIGERVLGEQPTFTKIVEHWPYGDLMAKLEATCEQNARQAHDALNLEENDKVLGVSILRKLRNEYSGRPEEFATFIGSIMRSAHPFLRFDAGQTQMVGADIGLDAQTPREPPQAIVVHRPDGADLMDFVQQVDGLVKQLTTGGGAAPNIVTRTDKQNEITVVSTVNSFPARYLELSQLLKQQYMLLLGDDRQSLRARLEMHTADECVDLPDIFPELGPPRDALPYLMLGVAFRFIKERVNPTHGRTEVILESIDRTGVKAELLLGRDIGQALEQMHGKMALDIRAEVDRYLRRLVHEDEKEALRHRLRDRLDNIAVELRGDRTHPDFRRERDATERAFELIIAGKLPG